MFDKLCCVAVTRQAASIILGSASPRRREILTALRVPFIVSPAAVDEARRPGEPATVYLDRVVLDKLASVTAAASDERVVLVADTIVVEGETVLGKPSSVADAEAMLSKLSGRAHHVFTRFALGRRAEPGPFQLLHAETVKTRVVFRALDAAEIAGYARTGEGLDKAGAYAIQGFGAFAVAQIEGSYSNVVGLPACEVVSALKRIGAWEPFAP